MNLMEQIQLEDTVTCYISFDVTDDSKLIYDIEQWKKVEGKLKSAWAYGHMFEIKSRVYLNSNGHITKFSIASEKKAKVEKVTTKLGEIEIMYLANRVFAEMGDVVRANMMSILSEIREAKLPRVFDEFQKLNTTKARVKVAYSQIKLNVIKEQLQVAEKELKAAIKRLKEMEKAV